MKVYAAEELKWSLNVNYTIQRGNTASQGKIALVNENSDPSCCHNLYLNFKKGN